MDLSQRAGCEDPRITGEYRRQIPWESGTLTLVGVVHDHPASTYRVRRTIEDLDPDVLALELPQIAIPLFEQYARTDRSPPVFGGEMSAAIQTASADVVGIDRQGDFFFGLARALLRKRPPVATAKRVLSNTATSSAHALVCRLAATIAARTSIRLEVDAPTSHDVDQWDEPKEQAADEREQVRKSRAFMNAFRSAAPSRASRFEDAIREEHMAERLSTLPKSGDVVAVVGIDHLEEVAERLVDE